MIEVKKMVGVHAHGSGILAQQNYAKVVGTQVYQVFLGAPVRYWAKKEEPDQVRAFLTTKKANAETVICHAPFLVNLADDVDTKNWKLSYKSMQNISVACVDRGISLIVVHSGSDKGRGLSAAKDSWLKALTLLSAEFPGICYCIENSAYKKNLFSDLEALESVVSACSGYATPPGICLDTAHFWSAGNDITPGSISRLSRLSKCIKVVHINNNPGDLGCNKDRHTGTPALEGKIPMLYFKSIFELLPNAIYIMELDNEELVSKSYEQLQSVLNLIA